LGATLINQNGIFKEIKSRLKCLLSFGAEYFSSSVLYRNANIDVYRTTVLPVVVYECQTWSLTLREEQRLRVFEKRMLRKILVFKRTR
jgi:hypothetical protein